MTGLSKAAATKKRTADERVCWMGGRVLHEWRAGRELNEGND